MLALCLKNEFTADPDYCYEVANDAAYIPHFPVCIGKQYPQSNGERGGMQKYFYAADHQNVTTLAELAALATVSGKSLPADATDADRKAFKAGAPFIILGGLKSGGATQRLTAAERQAANDDEAHPANQHRRVDDNMQAQPVLPLDFDHITPALFSALVGEPAADGAYYGGVLAEYCGVAFTSPSHTDADPRLKVAIVAAELVAPADKVTACLRLEAEVMAAAGCERDPAGGWIHNGEHVECDPAQYRISQVIYSTSSDSLALMLTGAPVVVDELPELDAAALAAAKANSSTGRFDEFGEHKYPLPANPTPAQGWALDAGGKLIKPNFIAMPGLCPWSELHSDPMDSKPGSWGLLLGGDVEHMCCKHAGCTAHRQELIAAGKSANYQYAVDAGMPETLAAEIWGGADLRRDPADEFDDITGDELATVPAGIDAAPVVMINGRAAFLKAKPGVAVVPYQEWDGKTGDPSLDFLREKIRDAYGVTESGKPAKHLRQIAPQIKPTYAKGELSGGVPLNHADNIRWLLYRSGVQLARNLMSWDLELFSRKTGNRIATEESDTLSFLIGQASKFNIPKEAIADHLTAVANGYSYHPVRRALDAGGEWDGVPRVQRVIDAVPVAPADRERRDALLWGLLAGAVAAVDSPTGSVAIKYVPVLYSEENDRMKTSFLLRVFGLIDGAADSTSLNPDDKTSLRANVYRWFLEWGELESMSKYSQAALKKHIGATSDSWRQENAKVITTKKRQSVYAGTCNLSDFLKELSLSSRLPVIAVTDVIDMDTVNQILGWQYIDGEARRVDPMRHVQFFLEVRHLRNTGQLSHTLPPEILEEVKRVNVAFVDKGNHYDAIREALLSDDVLIKVKDFTASDMATAIGRPKTENRLVGKALRLLVDEGLLTTRKKDGYPLYSLVNPKTVDLSVTAD